MATALTTVEITTEPVESPTKDYFPSFSEQRLSSTSSAGSSPRRQTVTLGRNQDITGAMSTSKPYRPSEYTRIKRMNTFKCVVKRPIYRHPPLKGKALSLNGIYDQRVGYHVPPSSNEINTTTTNQPSQPLPPEPEVQEIIMAFPAPSSTSTFSTSSDTSHHDEGFPSPLTSPIRAVVPPPPSHGICSLCKESMTADSPMVIFGDAKLHLDCFKCGHCRKLMGSMKEFLVRVDGTPLCAECTPSCHVCHEKVFHNHVSVLKKNFHEDCLACSRCKRKFTLLAKVYSSEGEPCCPSCISPVFSNIWSPTKVRSSSQPSVHVSRRVSTGSSSSRKIALTLSPSPSTDSGVSDSVSNDGLSEQVLHTLPASENSVLNPRLESLSRSITSYSANNTPKRMRGSVSAPNLTVNGIISLQRLSVTSLKDILFDETGSLLFLCHCVNQSAVELVAFWLDVEHFKHFDGGDEDVKLFAHHIVLKYIGYYAELPVPLPKDIQSDVFQTMELGFSQTMFNEAQQFILQCMERDVLPGFLTSGEGKKYIESLVDRELVRMKRKTPDGSTEAIAETLVRARVTNFDKRYMDTKYYVYEVEVQWSNGTVYTIYRRYSEWYSLNQKMRKAFPKESFPKLPKKIFLRRSQVRAVAEERMRQLQMYLQSLFTLNSEVLNYRILRSFLKQTDMDKEDEEFNKKITQLQRKKSS